METFSEIWTSGSIRPISLEMKCDDRGGLVQLDFAMSGIQQFRAVMDRSEFKSFVTAVMKFNVDLIAKFDKLEPGELDPRD